MATKKKYIENYSDKPPETLVDHPFYGLDMSDPEQAAFQNALWDSENRIVLVDACAGSGKSTVSLAVACLLYHYKRMDGILYIRVPTAASEGRLGFLPGSLAEKTKHYMQPLYNSLIKLDENPYSAVTDESMLNRKEGTGFITATTDVYIRGDDISKQVVIIDEAQNATEDQLRTIITRCHDDALVICAGSTRQIDLADKESSGFVRCINHFKDKPWAQVCTLSKNFRGEMSAWADLKWE